MEHQLVTSEQPLSVNDREGWVTEQVELEISQIVVNGETLEFESEEKIRLGPLNRQRDVFFQSEESGDEELIFFGLELKNNLVHLTPGNANVTQMWLSGISTTAHSQHVQTKRLETA